MKPILRSYLLITICFGLILTTNPAEAQSTRTRQVLDYLELKGLLLKHKPTVESMLSMKRFRLIASKEKAESTLFAYKKENDSIKIFVRIRKSDGLVSEIAWSEGLSTLGNLTHDAVDDGFVPVAGNSKYYNRTQNLALFVNYELSEEKEIPCMLRAL